MYNTFDSWILTICYRFVCKNKDHWKEVAFRPHAPFNLRNRSLQKKTELQSTWKINVFLSDKEFLWAIAAGKEKGKSGWNPSMIVSYNSEISHHIFLPKITESRHSVETGEDQYMQSNGIKECESSGIPASDFFIN